MLEDYQDKQRKQASRMRSIMDYTMGSVFVLIGVYFIVYDKLRMNFFNRQPSVIDYFLGALFILYGSWRIYRGYKKNYYR